MALADRPAKRRNDARSCRPSDSGRSALPQEPMKSVSPVNSSCTSGGPSEKHTLPGVWPGVWRTSRWRPEPKGIFAPSCRPWIEDGSTPHCLRSGGERSSSLSQKMEGAYNITGSYNQTDLAVESRSSIPMWTDAPFANTSATPSSVMLWPRVMAFGSLPPVWSKCL